MPTDDRLRAENYRGAHGVIVVFDVTNQTSFNNLKHWIQEISYYCDNVNTMIIGNKCDLVEQRVVDYDSAKAVAGDIPYFEMSAKNSINVEQIFLRFVAQIHRQTSEEVSQSAKKFTVSKHKMSKDTTCSCQ